VATVLPRGPSRLHNQSRTPVLRPPFILFTRLSARISSAGGTFTASLSGPSSFTQATSILHSLYRHRSKCLLLLCLGEHKRLCQLLVSLLNFLLCTDLHSRASQEPQISLHSFLLQLYHINVRLMSVDARQSLNCLRYPSRFETVSRSQLSKVHTGDLTRPIDNP
jgi:hypothetical protein